MRKLITGIFLLSLIFCFSTEALANSGPVFWQGYPSSEMMAVDKNSPIVVKNEDLVFDFSGHEEGSHYTISGEVTATYEMLNPTDEKQSVQMAFPYIEALDSLSGADISITDGGTLLPYDIYIGDAVQRKEVFGQNAQDPSLAFADIIGSLTNDFYEAKSFSANEKGKLYVIEASPTTEQRINLAVDFDLDFARTKVITKGFNRYERHDKKTKIAAWCYETETLELFVLGEDIDFTVKAYTDGELKEETEACAYHVSEREVELKAYLSEYIKKNTRVAEDSSSFATQSYNLYAKYLDEHFSYNMGYISVEDLLAVENRKRVLVLLYTVEFPPESEKEISVGYMTTGTMDMTKTAKPQYKFDYILNPADNWVDFQNLNIEIITPQTAPYIIENSIELNKAGQNLYSKTLSELPQNDLFFTLYEKEKISVWDMAAGKLQNSFGYITILLAIAAVLLVAALIVVMIVTVVSRLASRHRRP